MGPGCRMEALRKWEISFPCRRWSLFFPPKHPATQQSIANLLFIWYLVLIPTTKAAGPWSSPFISFFAEVENGVINPLPYAVSLRALGTFTVPKRFTFSTKRYKWLGKILVWAGFYAEYLDSRQLSYWWLAVGICCVVSRSKQHREARTTVFYTPSQQPAGSPAILRIPIS